MGRNSIENETGFRSDQRTRSVNPWKRLAFAGAAVGAIIFGACENVVEVSETPIPSGATAAGVPESTIYCAQDKVDQFNRQTRSPDGYFPGAFVVKFSDKGLDKGTLDPKLAKDLQKTGLCIDPDILPANAKDTSRTLIAEPENSENALGVLETEKGAGFIDEVHKEGGQKY